MTEYRDDVTALAVLGRRRPEPKEAATAFAPGTFTHFAELDEQGRRLVLRLLDNPQEEDWQELAARADGKPMAEWMLTLPVFAAGTK